MRERREHRAYSIGRRALLMTAACLAALALGGVLSATAEAQACTATTDNYIAGGGDWSVAANWSMGIPMGSEVACWDAGDTVTVSDTESVDSIQTEGNLAITGGSLTLTSTSDQSTVDDLSLEGGELDGPSAQTLTVAGSFDWGVTAPAALNEASGSDLAISQAAGSTLAIGGTVSWGGGSIATASPVTMTGASMTDTGAPTLNASAGVTFAGTVDVAASATPGTITADGITNTGTTSLLGLALDEPSGTNSLAGTLIAESLITAAGTALTVTSPTALTAYAGTISGAVTGTGTFTAGGTGATVIESGGSISTSAVDVAGGSLTVDSGATYAVPSATTIDGGELDFAGAVSTTGDLFLAGGELNGISGSTLAVTGDFLWSGGAINEPFGDALAIVQTGASAFSVSGSTAQAFDGGSIITAQPVLITSTNLDAANASALTTSSTITLGSRVDISGTGATFTAAGVSATATRNSGQTYGFGADGLVLTGGTTTVASGNTLESGGLTLTGGTLDGQGTLSGSVTNTSGTVSPGDPLGVLKVTGGYSQGSRGTLAIDLDGTVAGTGFSQLQIGGSTSLGGDLSLSDASGFIPEPGETFKILNSPAAVAGLLTLTGPGARSYTAQYDPHDVTLDVKPTPGNTVAPEISGTLSVGQTLNCSTGTWSAFPTKFTYQWDRDGSPISGATSQAYVVVAADQGHSLTCTVTASNSLGAGEPAASSAVSVPEPNTPGVVVLAPGCPNATGRLHGVSLGRLALGLSRAQARHTLTHYTVAGKDVDDFCLDGGGGISVGYPSSKLLGTLSHRERARVSGRIVIALTMNPYYALTGARPGMKLSAVAKRLHVGKVLRVGGIDWYIAPGKVSKGVLAVRGGIIQQIGIANEALTRGRRAQKRFLAGFKGA
jgi:hypothetical protein